MTKEVIELGFVGGLGDILARSFVHDPYFYISRVNHPVEVLLFSPCPYVAELFKYHPNRKNIRIHTFAMYPQFEKEHFSMGKNTNEERNQHKLDFLNKIFNGDFKIRPHGYLPAKTILDFHPSFVSRLKLKGMRRRGYAVIQPFASGEKRDLPAHILREIIRALAEKGLCTYIVTRNHVREHRSKVVFSPQAFLEKKVLRGLAEIKQVKIIKMSIPAVIELVRHAAFFVGGDSAFVKAAWHYRCPSVLLLPEFVLRRPHHRIQMEEKKGIYFGAGIDTNLTSTFESFDIKQMREFFTKSVTLIPQSAE